MCRCRSRSRGHNQAVYGGSNGITVGRGRGETGQRENVSRPDNCIIHSQCVCDVTAPARGRARLAQGCLLRSPTKLEYFRDFLVCIPRKSDAKLNQSVTRRCGKDPPVLGWWEDEGGRRCLNSNLTTPPLPPPVHSQREDGHMSNTVCICLVIF
ncbi:hypothetical protein J6590_041399 [Homalodisca vitripennis]|nr:hypothetical protein J6590_041399 [Homalodisca vitripennis]